MVLTSEQRVALLRLWEQLRYVAEAAGPLSAYWEPLADIDAVLTGCPTFLQKSAEEWIAYAERLLAEQRRRSLDIE